MDISEAAFLLEKASITQDDLFQASLRVDRFLKDFQSLRIWHLTCILLNMPLIAPAAGVLIGRIRRMGLREQMDLF